MEFALKKVQCEYPALVAKEQSKKKVKLYQQEAKNIKVVIRKPSNFKENINAFLLAQSNSHNQ
jgi:predicted transcriptional regulator